MSVVNRIELLEALIRVSPGTSNKNFIEQASCFVFRDGWIFTFNDEISCRIRQPRVLDAEKQRLNLVGAVRARQLTQMLENLSDDTVDVAVGGTEGKDLIVKAPGKRLKLRMEPEVVLPIDDIDAPEEWIQLPTKTTDDGKNEFAVAIERVVESAGKNDEEFITTCVHIHPDFLETTDRKQVSRYLIQTGIPSPFLARASSLRHVVDLGITEIGVTSSWVHLRNKGLIFSCRLHLEDFPSDGITKLMQFEGTPFKFPEGLDEIAKLARTLTEGERENDKIVLELTDRRLEVRWEGLNGGLIAGVAVAYRGDPVAFRITPAMLSTLLKLPKDCEIGEGKLAIRTQNWTYLTVLGAVDPDAKKESVND